MIRNASANAITDAKIGSKTLRQHLLAERTDCQARRR